MKNILGSNLTVTLFGESHGEAIGAVIDGISPGISVDTDNIDKMLTLRRPSGKISTARQEKDEYSIVSGVFEGKTTGTPICIIIPNKAQQSKDYTKTRGIARPGHADYTAYCKYHGYEDYRGGGHFSGRITAALVAAGAILVSALEKKGIRIVTHIDSLGGICDRKFENYDNDITELLDKAFPVLSDEASEKMNEAILEAKEKLDSIGGTLETVITGLPAGLGEPWFETVESKLAYAMMSVGGVKGIEFGRGFGFAEMLGSDANDGFRYEGESVVTTTNNNGGINGGITNGMPVTFRLAVKPTPSIYQKQETVDFINKENADIEIEGRHDPCILHRAKVVVDALTALVVADMLIGRYGTDYFTPKD
ncbi:MAG: chorismate synthase [Clostridia bacterium]|nr:chorismate synthase [Clostridia bacterium]